MDKIAGEKNQNKEDCLKDIFTNLSIKTGIDIVSLYGIDPKLKQDFEEKFKQKQQELNALKNKLNEKENELKNKNKEFERKETQITNLKKEHQNKLQSDQEQSTQEYFFSDNDSDQED